MNGKISEGQIRREFERLSGKASKEDILRAVKESDSIYEKVANSSVLEKEIAKVKLLLMLLKDYWDGKYTLPYRTIIAIVVALLYILNPIDLIPDILPFLGLTDDLSMLLFVWGMVSKDVGEYALWKVENADSEDIKKLIGEAFSEEEE